MRGINLETAWPFLLALASAVVLFANAIEKIVRAYKAAKAPGVKQDKRLDTLEDWRKVVDEKLTRNHERLCGIEEGNRVTQRALLALLDHGIDGNNVDQMERAKEMLQSHLINR